MHVEQEQVGKAVEIHGCSWRQQTTQGDSRSLSLVRLNGAAMISTAYTHMVLDKMRSQSAGS